MVHSTSFSGNSSQPFLERRRDCKRNTLLTFYSVMQSAEIGLVENQPNTSIKRKEKKNQEKEPKQKEVGEECYEQTWEKWSKDKQSNGNRIDSKCVTPTALGKGPASDYSSEATEGDESTLFRKRGMSRNLTNRLEWEANHKSKNKMMEKEAG